MHSFICGCSGTDTAIFTVITVVSDAGFTETAFMIIIKLLYPHCRTLQSLKVRLTYTKKKRNKEKPRGF